MKFKKLLVFSSILYSLKMFPLAFGQGEFFYQVVRPTSGGIDQLKPATISPLAIDFSILATPALPDNNATRFIITPFSRSRSFPAQHTGLGGGKILSIVIPVISDQQLGEIGNVLYWDGSDNDLNGIINNADILFSSLPTHTTLSVINDPAPGIFQNLIIEGVLDGGMEMVGPFGVDETFPSGASQHYHILYAILGDEHDPANTSPNGIYLMANRLESDPYLPSHNVYLILNKGLDPQVALLVEDFIDEQIIDLVQQAPIIHEVKAFGSTKIDVFWHDLSNDEISFSIERSQDLGQSWTFIAEVNANTEGFRDKGLQPNTQYTYRVRADRTDNHSAFSNMESSTTLAIGAYTELFSDSFLLTPSEEGDEGRIGSTQSWSLEQSGAEGSITSDGEKAILQKTGQGGHTVLSMNRELDTRGFIDIAIQIKAHQSATFFETSDFIKLEYFEEENIKTLLEDRSAWTGVEDLSGGTLPGNTETTATARLSLPVNASDNPTFKIQITGSVNARGDVPEMQFIDEVHIFGIENIPPLAQNDHFTVTVNTALNSLAVLNNNGYGIDHDLNNQPLHLTAVSLPSEGGLVQISLDDTEVVYTPQVGFSGLETFSYTLSDGFENSTALVSIFVEDERGFVAYNDLSWDSGQLTMNITRYTTDEGTGIPPDGSEGSLVDYESGDVLPVQLRVDGGRWNGPIHAAVGSSVLPQTDAYEIFNERVDMKGVINYSSSDIVLTFNGLNPALRYEIVCFGNRDNISYQNRLTQTQIVGAESYENRSTLGSVVQSIGSAQDSTIIVNGYNTENGYVARYTQIDPGQDWEVKIRVSDGGSTQPSKQYISALMLRAMLTEEHVVIQTTVSNSGDDAEEHLTRKTVSISSSDLELGEDKEEAQEVGCSI